MNTGFVANSCALHNNKHKGVIIESFLKKNGAITVLAAHWFSAESQRDDFPEPIPLDFLFFSLCNIIYTFLYDVSRSGFELEFFK